MTAHGDVQILAGRYIKADVTDIGFRTQRTERRLLAKPPISVGATLAKRFF